MNFRPIAAFFGLFSILFACNSSIDQSLLGDMTGSAAQLEDLIGQTATVGEQLSKFGQVIDRAPEGLQTDTAAHFSAFKEDMAELTGQHAAVNAQLNDMKIRLTVMMDDYAAGKLSTEVVKSEFGNFSASLTNIDETISSFAIRLRQIADGLRENDGRFQHEKRRGLDRETIVFTKRSF